MSRDFDKKGKPRNRNYNKSKGNEFERQYDDYASKGGSKEYKPSSNRNTNDITWWKSNKNNLVADYANVSFFNPVGANLPTWWTFTGATNPFPGIFVINTFPIPGIAKNPGDPVNLAMNNIYSNIRKANSGAKVYNAVHVMEYFLAMDSALCFYIHLVRAYSFCRTYSQTNRYFPEGVLEAMNFDTNRANPNCVLNDTNALRGLIDQLATILSAHPFLRDTYITQRHMSMYSYVYADHESNKAQFYLFNPAGYWKLDQTVQPAVMNPVNYQTLDLANIKQYVEDLIANVVTINDIAVIIGDIKKAYPDSALMFLSQIPVDMVATPVFSYEMLEQIQNMRWYHYAVDPGTNVITENPASNALIYNPTFYGADFMGAGAPTGVSETLLNKTATFVRKVMLNAHTDMPTPEQVVEMTRLMVGSVENLAINSSGIISFTYATLPTELVTYCEVIRYNYNQSTFSHETVSQFVPIDVNQLATDVPNLLDTLKFIRHFDWHPPIAWFYGTAQNTTKFDEVVETANYTLVEMSVIDKINTAALLNVWQIPE